MTVSTARLAFACAPDGLTYLAGQHAPYPYHLCRVLRADGDPAPMATVYLQSVSGGLYERDQLELVLAAGPDSSAHVTTQASTIVHTMRNGSAQQGTQLRAAKGAVLEYVPDPLILFPGARIVTDLRVVLDPSAAIFLSDSFLVHDPAGGGAGFDWLRNRVLVESEAGEVLVREQYQLTGPTWARQLPGVSSGFAAHGTLLLLTRIAELDALCQAVRGAMNAVPGIYAGASVMPGRCGVGGRLLAKDGIALRAGLQAGWEAWRRAITGASPRPRRK